MRYDGGEWEGLRFSSFFSFVFVPASRDSRKKRK